jgi:hypothetical protein
MISLIYTSTATRPMGRRDLVDLLEACRDKNRKSEVTGLLLYAEGCFMQVLEGPGPVVRNLMKKIEMDKRHRDVETLEVTALDCRAFPEWSMAFLDSSLAAPAGMPGYSHFLEIPSKDEDVIRPQARSRRLLLNFKLVMEASNTMLRGLLDVFPEE